MNDEHTADHDVEIRECWAVRWPDGHMTGAMFGDDGSDYAEQVIRRTARDVGAEAVHRTETITRTSWEVAEPRVTTPTGGARCVIHGTICEAHCEGRMVIASAGGSDAE